MTMYEKLRVCFMRERFSSRLGFILMSAGCAIGLGNVWRFPYIVGQYGGALFVLIYLLFLVLLGLPVMVMEFSVGRASQKSVALSFDVLEPKGSHWHWFKWMALTGNVMLMMFYTTVCGWLLYYFVLMATGRLNGASSEVVSDTFTQMLASPSINVGFMILSVLIGFLVISRGLNNGVERVSKYMMGTLLVLMMVLMVHSIFLPGAKEGLSYYLVPNVSRMMEHGWREVVFAAMGQAFFTLSLGTGAIAIFGSYIDKERRLTSEAAQVIFLDTLVAIVAGFIVIPACFAYHVDFSQGPGLIFVSLPNIFSHMPMGQLWGSMFFLFMSFAALTTIIAVFQVIVDSYRDLTGQSLKQAVAVCMIGMILLSLPCALGFNVLSFIEPIGQGTTIQDLEDFIVSNNLLPLGSMFYVLFCCLKNGWGWKNFLKEANTGTGIKFPKGVYLYCTFGIPLIILFIFVQGYIQFFS